MITGFQAQMSVDDAGTGAAVGGADTKFSGLTTFNLPSLEAGKYEATELDQQVTSVADPYERELPTGLIKIGPTKAEIKYTKANFQRLQSLLGVRDHVYKLISPDDLTTPGTPVKMTVTLVAFVSKLDEVKFEKGNPIMIPFEITVQQKPTVA